MRPKLIPLVASVVLAVLVACDRSEPEEKQSPPAASQAAAPPASAPEAAGQPEIDEPSDSQPETKPWVMPSAEKLAVMAAALDHELAKLKSGTAERSKRTVFLSMHKEEEAALLPMLPQHVPPLKESSTMRVNEASGHAFDSEAGQPAVVLWVGGVSIIEQARPGPEATAVVGTATLDAVEIYGYRLSKASGRWVVISRELRVVS